MPGIRDTAFFINSAVKVHGSRYDYTDSVYIRSHIKLTIICKYHGPFTQRPANHIAGDNCPTCSPVHRRYTRSEWLTRFREVHGDRYKYSDASKQISARKKIKILCREHGPFLQEPRSHYLQGAGCPTCTNIGQKLVSRACDEWLDKLGIDTREWRVPDTKMVADGYDPETNTIYEFFGSFWHGDPAVKRFRSDIVHPVLKRTYGQLYIETNGKIDRLKSLGYRVIHIWESEWTRSQKQEEAMSPLNTMITG